MPHVRTAFATICGAALLASPLSGATTNLRWQHHPGVQHAGEFGVLTGDLDGDGRAETIFSTRPFVNDAALAVVAHGDDGLALRQQLPVSPGFASRIAIGDVDGKARVLLAMEDGPGFTMVEYGELPLRELRRIGAPGYTRPLAIADIDADGTLDMLAMQADFAYLENPIAILDYETGETRWADTQLTSNAIVAQLDADPALEIVIAGVPGRVLDGATRLPEWVYPAGFESALFAGTFDASHPSHDLAALSFEYGGALTLFRSAPYSPLREVNAGFGHNGGAVVDVDDDGLDEIVLAGTGIDDGVAVYTPAEDALRRIVTPDMQPTHVSAADVIGDPTPELLVFTSQAYATPDAMRVIDMDTEATLAVVEEAAGPYAALARLDLDADGQDEVVHALLQRDSEASMLRVACVLDARSGKRERCITRGPSSSSGPTSVAPVPGRFNETAGEDFAFADGEWITVYDGASLEPQWQRRVLENGYLRIDAAAAMRFNADEIDDVVLLDWTARMYVLDGRDGSTLWESVTLGPELLYDEKTLTVANVDADPAPEILVTVPDALYAFDSQTRLLDWSLSPDLDIGRFLTWGSGDACRLGLYDPEGRLQAYRCDDRAPVGAERALPVNANLLRFLDAGAEHLLVGSAGRIFTVAADDTTREWARDLGSRLGNNNAGAVIPLGGDRYEVIVGSDTAVSRIGIHIDLVFSDAFE